MTSAFYKRFSSCLLAALLFSVVVIACDDEPEPSSGEPPVVVNQLSASSEQVPAPTPASSPTFTLSVGKFEQSKPISPSLYGVFFEEINHSGDGGLYAELISNRSFEDNPDVIEHWSVTEHEGSEADIKLITKGLLNIAQKHALRLTVKQANGETAAGITNGGYWGIHLVQGDRYTLSFYARSSGGYEGSLTARGEDGSGKKVIAAELRRTYRSLGENIR